MSAGWVGWDGVALEDNIERAREGWVGGLLLAFPLLLVIKVYSSMCRCLGLV